MHSKAQSLDRHAPTPSLFFPSRLPTVTASNNRHPAQGHRSLAVKMKHIRILIPLICVAAVLFTMALVHQLGRETELLLQHSKPDTHLQVNGPSARSIKLTRVRCSALFVAMVPCQTIPSKGLRSSRSPSSTALTRSPPTTIRPCMRNIFRLSEACP